jgi:hypothetical protein
MVCVVNVRAEARTFQTLCVNLGIKKQQLIDQRVQGPEGRPLNVSPARKGWDTMPQHA